jgi:hypothetical protein
MYPSAYPEVHKYSHLRRLLQAHVDMQFEDVRTLLMLPRGKTLPGGCNFAAATMLFNIIAGSSVALYNTSEQALAITGDRGKRFRSLLSDFYPWDGEKVPKSDFASILYDLARNPLSHSLGLDPPPSTKSAFQTVEIVKWPLTRARILKLEESVRRPKWALATIADTSDLIGGGKKYALSIPALYWGVHGMLRSLFADTSHAVKAEALAEKYEVEWTWHIEVV